MVAFVTKEVHRFLVLHAFELQNNKINIAGKYLADYEKYIQVLNYLNSYIKTIEKYMDLVDIAAGEHILPFAIIGSLVEIQDTQTNQKRKIIIKESCTEKDVMYQGAQFETVSFLSSLGRSLLFKEVGQSLTVENEKNKSIAKITRIHYDLNL